MSMLLLNLLIIVPFIAYRLAKHRAPHHLYSITGASLGAVIAPFIFGLYSWYFISIIGIVPGMLGLILVMFHEAPGFHLAVSFGVVPEGKVVSGFAQRSIVALLNGVVWLVCYGFIGYIIDRFRAMRKQLR